MPYVPDARALPTPRSSRWPSRPRMSDGGFRVRGSAMSRQLSANGRVRPGRTNPRSRLEWCVKGRTLRISAGAERLPGSVFSVQFSAFSFQGWGLNRQDAKSAKLTEGSGFRVRDVAPGLGAGRRFSSLAMGCGPGARIAGSHSNGASRDAPYKLLDCGRTADESLCYRNRGPIAVLSCPDPWRRVTMSRT